jgi:hypothetical protein
MARPKNEKQREVIPLDEVRADGWFERLATGSAAFTQLCQIVGDRFVAFSIVAGLRITALQVDGRNPERSAIEFSVGDVGASQRMTLGDFRRRLSNALVTEEDMPIELSVSPSNDDLQAFLGVRNVLLAPILGIELTTLHRSKEGIYLSARIDDTDMQLTVDELRETVRERIRAEAEKYRTPTPFALDLSILPEVERAAAAGQHQKVISLLGSWPGPLSVILRTPEGAQIPEESRTQIVGALGMLGSAYAGLDRHDWAEDVLRLGIQWGGEGRSGADLFRRLGDAYLANERAGEAIGLLRRAMALGGEPALVLPLLSRAFASRQRHLAAIVCAEDALSDGASEEVVESVRSEALGALGQPWERFREFMAGE